MSAPADQTTVTRAQVLAALDDPALRESFGEWHSVLMHARHLATQLAGLDAALAAVDALYLPADPAAPAGERGRNLDPDRVPTAWNAGRTRPGVHLAVSAAEHLLRTRWIEVLHRYGRLAQAAVDLIASGSELPAAVRRGTGLPGEPSHRAVDPVDPPRCELPHSMWDNPEWAGVRGALGRVRAAEQAVVEYNDMTFAEDPDTGEERYYLPEHRIDEAADLEVAADDWPHGVAEYADAVVHLLATRPELRPAGGAR